MLKIAAQKVFQIVTLVVVALIVLALAARWHRRQVASAPDSARAVTAQPVRRRDVPVWLQALGTVTPLNTVIVRAQVAGTLTGVHFREAQIVHVGDVLATIDDRSLQAQVTSAAGSLERDQALLANARRDLERDHALIGIGSLNQQQLDTQIALVRQYQGTVKADQGSLDNLRVQLGFTQVRAPIDGRAGLRAVDAGNYVQPSDSAGIVTLTSLSPTSVKFAVSEDDLASILAMREQNGDAPLVVQAYDRAGTTLLETGTLDAINNQVDTSTGTVMMRAIFDDVTHRLYPNQFVNVRLQLKTLRNAQVVPTRAIQHGSQGDYVYIDEQGKAAVRGVRVGPSDGDDSVVLPYQGAASALHDNDVVVVEGADSIDAGVRVKPATTRAGTE